MMVASVPPLSRHWQTVVQTLELELENFILQGL